MFLQYPKKLAVDICISGEHSFPMHVCTIPRSSCIWSLHCSVPLWDWYTWRTKNQCTSASNPNNISNDSNGEQRQTERLSIFRQCFFICIEPFSYLQKLYDYSTEPLKKKESKRTRVSDPSNAHCLGNCIPNLLLRFMQVFWQGFNKNSIQCMAVIGAVR